MRITVKMLQDVGACDEQIKLFNRMFPGRKHPTGVLVTIKGCRAVAEKFQWSWAAHQLLPSKGYAMYKRLNCSHADKFWKSMDAAIEKARVKFSHVGLYSRAYYKYRDSLQNPLRKERILRRAEAFARAANVK